MPRTPRPLTPLRLLMLLAVALCLVLKPALGLAGELHRDLHELAHQAAAQEGAAAATLAGEVDEHAPADGWHGVLHIDLCCSNAGLPADIALPGSPALVQPSPPYHARQRAPAPAPEFLRPPIRA
jgi:hypothetical protein